MKGVIFNLLEAIIVAQHGEAAWDDILDAAGLAGSYTSLGSYPDEEIHKLLLAGSSVLGTSPNGILRWYGRQAMPLLAKQYPQFFTGHRSTLSFVRSLNSIIHPEVRKLYDGARCPNFDFAEDADGALLMSYDSPRRLCVLAQGLVEGAGDCFGESVTVEHVQCTHAGDRKCLLRIHVDRPDTGDAAKPR